MAEGPENASDQQKELSSTKDETTKGPTSVENGEEDEELLQNIFELDYHPDCPVCLQQASYPVKLPCGHIFCFLCIKGVALRSRKCAICRQAIAIDYLDKPTLVKVVSPESPTTANAPPESEETEYAWFYEGRNGWWQYDNKTSKEVELAFKSGKRSSTLLIAGFLYLIDFENMFQMRRNEPGRRRRIKRDKPTADRKGVAGIRLQGLVIKETAAASEASTPSSSKTEESNDSASADRVDQSSGTGETITAEASADSSDTDAGESAATRRESSNDAKSDDVPAD